eukprot:7773213-Karenia_brevis.AAC.1
MFTCEPCGQPQRAAPLLDEMRREGLSLNAISFSAAMSACEKGRQWQRAVPLLDEMRQDMSLNVISF